MLMGSMPYQLPTLCMDCGTYFWLGLALGLGIAVILALLAVHYLKG